MKKHFYYLALGMILVSIQSCIVYKNGPASAPTLSRYKTLADPVKLDDANAPIDINVISSLNPEPGDTTRAKTILNLQGEGQRELISQYGKLYSTKPEEFKTALSTLYLKPKGDSGPADFSNKSIAVTISVTKKWTGTLNKDNLALGDRLENIKMEFKLDSGRQGVYFDSWDRVKTQYGRFFIGSRSFTGNQEVNINPSITLASAAAFSLGSVDSKSQYTEQDTLSQLTVVSNGILNDDNFSLDQTGTPKTTLLGNSIINLKIGTKTPVSATFFSFDNLYNDGKVTPLAKVKIDLKNYWISDNSKDITGTLTCTYKFRHVTKSDRTYAESDDTVQYQYGTIKTDVKLVDKKDLMPKYWYIRNGSSQQNIQVQDLLNTSIKIRDLAFASEDEAIDFLGWLIQVSDPASKFMQKEVAKPQKGKALKVAVPAPVPLVFNNRYALVTTKTGNGAIQATPIKTRGATNVYSVEILQLR
jgi:hypothetical protein